MKEKNTSPEEPRAGKFTSKSQDAISHLASFPEYNPNPVIELEADGHITYMNPASARYFPGLARQEKMHPFLDGWDTLTADIIASNQPLLVRDMKVGSRWFEQAVSWIPEIKRFRIYARNITTRKDAETALINAHEDLETRVRQRTRELDKTNEILKVEIEERKRAEKSVQAEKQQFDDVLETLPCYLILLTPDYHVIFANRFFRERFGESHGRRCFEYLFERAEPCEICETFKVLKKMKPLEWEWVGPDGRNYYIYDYPFKATDGSTLIMEVGIDITLQKQALEALREAHDELETRVQERTRELKEVNRLLRARMVEHSDAEKREKRVAEEWQATFDSISDMVSIQDRDCRLVRVNKAYADAVGMPMEELKGQHCYSVIHGAICPVDNCPNRQTLETCKAVTSEIFEPRLGLYLEVSTSPIFDDAGELVGTVHIAKDISERKRGEEALRESQHDLNRAQEVSRTGSWRLNILRNLLTWSDETYRMFGIPQGTPMTFEDFLAKVYPDDREYVKDSWQSALRGEVYDIEHRITVSDEVKWVREKAELEYDRYERLVGGFGTVQDITERKKAQETLHQINNRLELAYDAAGAGAWDWVIDTGRIEWSPKMFELFGFDPEQTIPSLEIWESVIHPDDREIAVARIHRALKKQETLSSEYRVVVKGETRWISTMGKSVYDRNRQPVRMSGICTDITERKKNENDLIQLNRELRAVTECNQAIVRAPDENALYTEVCRIMCDVVGYRLAWVGAVEHDEAKSVRPVAAYGDDNDYLSNSNITWAETELGQGPTGVAVRTGKTDFCQDFATDPKAAPWRKAALARGFHSSIAIPLSDFTGSIFAVFMLYAEQPGSFTPAEVELLEGLAGDLSFGIAVLREKASRRRAEASLRETRDYLDSLINYASAPIIVWDPDFRITRFNHAFERLTGLTAVEILGQQMDILFPDDSREESMRQIREASSGGRMEAAEIPVVHRSGEIRILLWNSANIYRTDSGAAVATIAQGQDITDRKKTEQMKDEFIGLVSHELRTPLTIITGSLRTAMSASLTEEEIRELIQNGIEGADQLGSILENMLELSRYQAGHLRLRAEPVSIPGTARSIIKKLKDQGVTHKFLTDFPKDLPPVEADPVRVDRILYNLVENATKYAPDGTRIRVSARTDGDFVITSVKDEGPGIAPEDREKLFELFQQLENSTRPASGAGLGLVVCKRLVEAQGGWIKVDSTPGKGSTFSFALPQSSIPR